LKARSLHLRIGNENTVSDNPLAAHNVANVKRSLGMRDERHESAEAINRNPAFVGFSYSIQQPLDQLPVQRRQALEIVERYALIDMVDRGVDRADLDALRTEWSDKARIRGAAAGTFLRRLAGDELAQHFTRNRAQPAFRGVERLAASVPLDGVLKVPRVTQRADGSFLLLGFLR
jgi:hypothetical protein